MALKNFTGGPPPGTPGGNGNGAIIGIPIPPQQSQQQAGSDPAELLINYNEKYASAGTILFRDEIIQQTLSGLIGKDKPNVLLIGPAGTGKTKIVEDIAYRLQNNDPLIPDKLQGYVIYELPLSNIVSGSSLVGQMEQKIQEVIAFAENPANKVILFIDEIHQMFTNAGNTYQTIAQILKPAMSRGNIRVIGATTTQEVGELYKDPAFNRRFTRVTVDELTRPQTVEILKHAIPSFFKHYGNKIQINPNLMSVVAEIADNHNLPGSHRPDNALTLLDRSISDAIINRKLQEIQAANDPVMLQAIKSVLMIPITERQIRKTAIRLMTGNSKKDALDENALWTSMQRIKGQDDILKEIFDKVRRHETGLFPRKKPMVLFFIGPSGVGKTEIAKIIANEITGRPPIVLNMTEYIDSASVSRIIGAPPGYIGYDSHAELPFDCLESNPYQVILLDEFEKGHKSVQTLFMQALDEGYITNSQGRIIDFSKAIIIVTSNAAHKENTAKIGIRPTKETASKASMVKELSKWFEPSLLNRLQPQFLFHEITREIYTEILVNTYAENLERIRVNMPRVNLPDTIPDDELEELVNSSYVPEFGARPIQQCVQTYIENKVMP